MRAMMSSSRRWWTVAVSALVLAGVGAWPTTGWAAASGRVPAARALSTRALGTPDQVIDSKANPDLAAEKLNEFCATSQNCQWVNTADVTAGYGPAQPLGDMLYNCSQDAYAENTISLSESRGETTSVSERLSVKVSVDILGLAKASAEVSAFSKQASKFETTVEDTNAVSVPPMWRGWTQTRIFSALVHGSMYITDGVHLIDVSDMDLTFPGYMPPDDHSDTPVDYQSVRTPMTPEEIATHCNVLSGLGGGLGASPPPTGSFTIAFCPAIRPPAFTAAVRRATMVRGCTRRRVSGTPPPLSTDAAATLTRAATTYAAGRATRAGIQLTIRRRLGSGGYTLTIKDGKLHTLIPVKIV